MWSCIPRNRSTKMLPFLTYSPANSGKNEICHAALLTELDAENKKSIIFYVYGNTKTYLKWRDSITKGGPRIQKHTPESSSELVYDNHAMNCAKIILEQYQNKGELTFKLLEGVELQHLIKCSKLPFLRDRPLEEARLICCVVFSQLSPDVKDTCLKQLTTEFKMKYSEWCDMMKNTYKQTVSYSSYHTRLKLVEEIVVRESESLGAHHANWDTGQSRNKHTIEELTQKENNTNHNVAICQPTIQQPVVINSNIQPNISNLFKTGSNHSREPALSYNMLLLGETGVGKTTFINAILNYLNVATLERAHNSLAIAIDTQFIATDDQMKAYTVTNYAQAQYGDRGSRKEHLNATGESSTQMPHIYTLPFPLGSSNCELKILDTPGFNDTAGVAKDEENSQKIMEKLEDIGHVHAICILMKPNQARLTSDVRYLLEKVLQLHKNVAKNIYFCFTNAKKPGESLACLKAYLNQIEKVMKVKIEANRDNVFWFDNSCFRYLCSVRVLNFFRTEHLDNYNSILWNKNVEMSKRFISKLSAVQPVSVFPTTRLSKLERSVNHIVRQMYYSLSHTRKDHGSSYNLDNVDELILLCAAINRVLKHSSLIFLKDPFVMAVDYYIYKAKRDRIKTERMKEWLRVYHRKQEAFSNEGTAVDNRQLDQMVEGLQYKHSALGRKIAKTMETCTQSKASYI